ncbi:hypothetical protein RCL1_002089 [Eukaryota sp. TZLM3-RCL]
MQLLLKRPVIPQDEFDRLLNSANTEASLQKVHQLNEFFSANRMSFRVQTSRCPYTENAFVGLAYPSNPTLPTSYSLIEREYFTKILKFIISNDEFVSTKLVPLDPLLTLGSTLSRTTSTADLLTFLALFVTDSLLYLQSNEQGDYYGLGPRSMIQWSNLISDNCELCLMCQEHLFTGLKCFYCSCVMHRNCFEEFLANRAQNNVISCPQCRQNFHGP